MGDVQDKVRGLKLGAEDYMVKPFEIIELLARVERVLRRYNKVSQTLTAYDIEGGYAVISGKKSRGGDSPDEERV